MIWICDRGKTLFYPSFFLRFGATFENIVIPIPWTRIIRLQETDLYNQRFLVILDLVHFTGRNECVPEKASEKGKI